MIIPNMDRIQLIIPVCFEIISGITLGHVVLRDLTSLSFNSQYSFSRKEAINLNT